MATDFEPNKNRKWKIKAYNIIFEADTFGGKLFDILLLIAIFLSVIVVILESVKELRIKYGELFNILEWTLTIVFTIEYFLRIIIVSKPRKYVKSFFGIIDFISILPSIIGFILVEAQSFMIIRAFRLLRVFRIFKLTKYLGEASQLSGALKASRNKITIFIGTIVIIVTILGAVMYIIEPDESGFTNIPKGIYWAVVTLTTVGYGDIAPITPLGQIIASFIMVLGYGIIAVPTGIVTAEMNKQQNALAGNERCTACNATKTTNDAAFCHVCGNKYA